MNKKLQEALEREERAKIIRSTPAGIQSHSKTDKRCPRCTNQYLTKDNHCTTCDLPLWLWEKNVEGR